MMSTTTTTTMENAATNTTKTKTKNRSKTSTVKMTAEVNGKKDAPDIATTTTTADGSIAASCSKTTATTKSTSTVPVVSFGHGMRRKASAAELHSWVALALTLDGRDKITKVLQYACRLLAWWMSAAAGGTDVAGVTNVISAAAAAVLARRFNSLKGSLTTSRKAFRIGRSVIEFHRIRAMGILETLRWHLRQTIRDADGEDDEGESEETSSAALAAEQRRRMSRALYRKASSNIGWGPSTIDERLAQPSNKNRPTLLRSLSSFAYRRMYRPMASTLSAASSTGGGSSSTDQSPETPLWQLLGTAIKMMGLFGFWGGDNVNFLAMSGFLDDYELADGERLLKRKELQTRASHVANRCYFTGAVAGLLVSLRSYLSYRNGTVRQLRRNLDEAIAAASASASARIHRERHGSSGDDAADSELDDDDHREEIEAAEKKLDRARERQFVMFLALLKSCCDVLVFSNNPGIDLWKKKTGKKMHEGFHCACGLLSASTVIYNNFPNAAGK